MPGLFAPSGVAFDAAGNLYIADTENYAIKEWAPTIDQVTTLVTNADWPSGLAVDGAGNVYFSERSGLGGVIAQWNAANNTVTTVVSGLHTPVGVAVDDARNIYVADRALAAIFELPSAFVDPTPKVESASAGNDSLPSVEPPTVNLLPPFAPTSKQSWLTITGITNGVVSFSVDANPGLPGYRLHKLAPVNPFPLCKFRLARLLI